MASKINPVAIMSGNYALESKFYESYFGMKNSPNARPHRAVSIVDGAINGLMAAISSASFEKASMLSTLKPR